MLLLLSHKIVGIGRPHQLLARLLQRLYVRLLLLKGHLLLLIDDGLLNNSIDLFDGGARVIG